MRALEVIELTGQPFTASQPPIDAPARWGTLILGLATAPEWLNPRVEARTRMMFRRGLVDEVESLITEGLVAESTAGRAIGYSQVLAMLRGTLTYDDAIEKTITGTRRYIRRQRSWFRRDPRTQWIDAADDTLTEAMSIIDSYARVYHPADHA